MQIFFFQIKYYYVVNISYQRKHLRSWFLFIRLYIAHDSSKGPTGRQFGPLDTIFLQISNRKGHKHILTKIGEKNRVLSGIGPFDN